MAKGTLSSWPSACVAPTTANGFTLSASYELGPGGEQWTELNTSTGTLAWAHTNVYAAGSRLLATYYKTDTYLALTDWLGSKRAEVAPGGTFSTDFSLPWGNDLRLGGDANDATEHHFTGKERDSESGNDYFGARYYASAMGRFLSPDWSAKVEPVPYSKLDDPQSLDLYSYVGNNPLVRVDADGHVAAGSGCRQGVAACSAAIKASNARTDKQIHDVIQNAKDHPVDLLP